MTEQEHLDFWTKALNLPDFRVVQECRDSPNDPICFTVVPAEEVARCPGCGHACALVHRRHDSKPMRDLPIGPRAVNLIVRTPQLRWDRCERYFTPSDPAIAPGAHATERFLEQAVRLIRFSDIATVAEFFAVPPNRLARWYSDDVERQQPTPPAELNPIKSIGIDELSLKKSIASS